MWVEFTICLVTAVTTFFMGMYYGRKSQRLSITSDFDTIVRRAKHMLRAGEIAKLDMFLHDLTEDDEYIPNVGLQRLDLLIHKPYTSDKASKHGDMN